MFITERRDRERKKEKNIGRLRRNISKIEISAMTEKGFLGYKGKLTNAGESVH